MIKAIKLIFKACGYWVGCNQVISFLYFSILSTLEATLRELLYCIFILIYLHVHNGIVESSWFTSYFLMLHVQVQDSELYSLSDWLRKKNHFFWSPPLIQRTLHSNILVSLHLRAERTHAEAFLYNLFKFNYIKKKKKKIRPKGCWCLVWQVKRCTCPLPASALCGSGCSCCTARWTPLSLLFAVRR